MAEEPVKSALLPFLFENLGEPRFIICAFLGSDYGFKVLFGFLYHFKDFGFVCGALV